MENQPMNSERRAGKLRAVSGVLNFIGGVAGLLAICTVLWKGGALERQLNIDTGRIDELQQKGSPALMAHIEADDQRVAELSRRISDQETSIKQYGELKVEIRVVATKLDGITENLKGMQESASANAKAAEAAAQSARVAAAAVEKMLESRKQ